MEILEGLNLSTEDEAMVEQSLGAPLSKGR